MIAWGQPPNRPENRLGVRLLGWTNLAFCRGYHRLTVYSPPKLPREGPAILICNHSSGLDPLLIQSCCTRLIVWMMAREYYDIGALKWVFQTIDAIPVSRNGRDMSATRAALRALDRGQILGIFPEGKIETERALLPFQPGAAMMAIKTGVPVFPAFLDGTQRNKEMAEAFFMPNRVKIAFGPEIKLDRTGADHPRLDVAASEMARAVIKLARSMRSGAKIG